MNDALAPIVPDGTNPAMMRRAFERVNVRIDQLRNDVEKAVNITNSVSGIIKASGGVFEVASGDSDYQEAVTWGDGLEYASGTASVDIVSSAGLEFVSGELGVAIASSGGITLVSGELALDVAGLSTAAGVSGTDTVAITDGASRVKAAITDVWAAGFTQQTHVADATTAHAITDPADTPVDADALRDDLVLNTIPDIESKLDSLGTTINAILSRLETLSLFASS